MYFLCRASGRTEYDPELRKATGTYYTPHEVVDQMVRLAEEALVTELDKPKGFFDSSVTTIDPAMGTGTFLHSIIEHVAENVAVNEGSGAVPGAIQELASCLIGFELQLGSYAVAELRTADLLRAYEADPPKGGMRMFVADTLSDPHAAETQLGSGMGAISDSKRRANKIKTDVPITVVIGNPPYRDKAEGLGGWIEKGASGIDALAESIGLEASHKDVLASIAGVVSHPAFTATFEDELTTPGVCMPITKDPQLWQRAVELGREVVWLHTYAESFVDNAAGREQGNVKANWPSGKRPLSLRPSRRCRSSFSTARSNTRSISRPRMAPITAPRGRPTRPYSATQSAV